MTKESAWNEPFVFRGLKFREHSEGIGIQVYHPQQKKWYDIEGLNWRTSKDYYSHQYDIGLWQGRSYFGSIKFPEHPLEERRILKAEAVNPEVEIQFETQERIKEADTEYLRRRGVKKLGHREVFTAKETTAGIEICGASATKYYFDDKEEELPAHRACVDLPKEFLAQLKAVIEKIIEEQ